MVCRCYTQQWRDNLSRTGGLTVASLRIFETAVHGCVSVWTDQFKDHRGYFSETFNRADYAKAGLPTEWPQDNVSNSNEWVLRGLHIQRKNPQGKLVRCIKGMIWDCCVDLRKDSPTFGKSHGQLLQPGHTLYCPPGTAHGFLAMAPRSIVYYKCTTLYDKESDGGIFPLDPDLKIPWPVSGTPVMSEKDRNLPSLKQWLNDPRGLIYE